MKRQLLITPLLLIPFLCSGQKATWYSSTDNDFWKKQKDVKLETKAAQTPLFSVSEREGSHKLKHWGTTFNELDWDAFLALSRDEQDRLMHDLFAPDGDLRFTRGRIGMNSNDYGREWFS